MSDSASNVEVPDIHVPVADVTDNTNAAANTDETNLHEDFDIRGCLKGITGTEDELYNLYRRHSDIVGFSVKKATSRRGYGGALVEKYYLCSCSGVSKAAKSPMITPSPPVNAQPQEGEPKKRRRRQNTTSRVNCNAQMRIKLISNKKFVVHEHIVEHNHERTRPEWSHFHRSNRKITDDKAEVMEMMERALVKPTNAFKYMVEAAGGQENVGNIQRDHINYITRYMTKNMGGADAQTVLDMLKKRQEEDPQFYFTPKLDENGRLCSLYWRDSMMKDDYELYGDVMIFDTTFRTNKYGLICAPFVGVNNHWNNVMFACAFIANESAESFVWLLNEFMKSMGNKKPITIFTDQDKAITKAIAQVFGDDTRHRLCLWHLYQNAISKVPRLRHDKVFNDDFNLCLYGFTNEEDFEEYWSGMVYNYDLEDESWFRRLYKLKENWSPALSKTFFSAGILSSQRSESTNNAISFKSNKLTSLTQFFRLFDAMIVRWRTNESLKEFKNSFHAPKIYMPSGLVKHAAEVYTLKIFKYFQKEFRRSLETVANLTADFGERKLYDVYQEDDVDDISSVLFIKHPTGRIEISCGCKHFEEVGWLCKHCIRVLDKHSITRIPEQYIMLRWTKTLKNKVWDRVLHTKSTNANAQDCISWRQKMNRRYSELVLKSEGNTEARKILEDGFKRDFEAIQRLINSTTFPQKPEEQAPDSPTDTATTSTTTASTTILDPSFANTKGRKKARIKNKFERKGKKLKTTEFVQYPDKYLL